MEHMEEITRTSYDLNQFETIWPDIQEGSVKRLSRFFKTEKTRIREKLHDNLQKSSIEPYYRSYLLDHSDGRERVGIYIDLFELALKGEFEPFIEDQKSIGYIRAMEGYQLNDVFEFTMAFKDALWRTSRDVDEKAAKPLKNEDIFRMFNILNHSFFHLSRSFIRTRDEIIARHRDQLKKFQEFSAEVVSIFNDQKIWLCAIQGVFDIFNLNGTFFVLDRSVSAPVELKDFQVIGYHLPYDHVRDMADIVLKTPHMIGVDADNQKQRLNENINLDKFKMICVPIHHRKSQNTRLLFLHQKGNIFKFSKFDRNLLFQFAHFTGSVIYNSGMVSEIAEKQKDLRKLTGKLISVREQERKRIAGNIHDTLTQALSGIGYKALYCIELAEVNGTKLKTELNQLAELINQTLKQSRNIISDLRPHILDDIGVIAAFKNFIRDFENKFQLRIQFSHPDRVQLNSRKRIALFRIFQETLNNIQRHAAASNIDVQLSIEAHGRLKLIIEDDGCGFDIKRRKRSNSGFGMGLILMRERAEDVGGIFQINSSPDNGCKTTVIMPLD
jgi:signal transduction histidine kinase